MRGEIWKGDRWGGGARGDDVRGCACASFLLLGMKRGERGEREKRRRAWVWVWVWIVVVSIRVWEEFNCGMYGWGSSR